MWYYDTMRGTPCSACNSPQLAEIDEALMCGEPIIPTAQRFGLSKSALGRHRLGCLGPRIAAAARATRSTREVREPVQRAKAVAAGDVPTLGDVLSLTDLLARIERSLRRLETGAIDAAENSLPTALAAVSGQLHKGIEVAAKLQGIGTPDTIASRPAFSISIHIPQKVPIKAASSIEGEILGGVGRADTQSD